MSHSEHLKLGQEISAIALPDYNADGAAPFQAGSGNVAKIKITELPGPMGHYMAAAVHFENGAVQLHPLHLCDYIAI